MLKGVYLKGFAALALPCCPPAVTVRLLLAMHRGCPAASQALAPAGLPCETPFVAQLCRPCKQEAAVIKR